MQSEPQQSTWLYEVLAWLEYNRRLLLWSLAGVLALIVAGYIFFWSRHHAEIAANEALLALRPRTAADEGQKSATPADFLRFAEEHGSSSATERALLLAAGELFRDAKYAEAQSAFQKALDRDHRGPLAPTAALGIAASLDAQDKVDEAITAYQRVVSDFSGTPASARAKFALALIHETRNQPEQALRIYDELSTGRKFGRASMEASVKREALLKLHPELAPKTNVAVTLPPINVIAGTNAPAATNKIAGQP